MTIYNQKARQIEREKERDREQRRDTGRDNEREKDALIPEEARNQWRLANLVQHVVMNEPILKRLALHHRLMRTTTPHHAAPHRATQTTDNEACVRQWR